MTRKQQILIAVAGVAGVAAVGYGVAYAMRKRRSGVLLGRQRLSPGIKTHTTRANGMTVTRYVGNNLSLEDRIALLQDLVWQSVHDPEMRKLALSVTRHCEARDDVCETRAVYDWVRKNVRYTGDVAPVAHGAGGKVDGIDYYQTAKRTVQLGGGDCDDHFVLGATLLALNGIQSRGRITSQTSRNRDDYSHIYAVARLPKNAPAKDVPIDTTLPNGDWYGREYPHGKRVDFVA
jgi:transglutaminase-like putative cysteine protease